MSDETAEVFADATQAAGTGEAIIEIVAMDKWFDDFQALKDINMVVGRQEVVVVCGPSGSGKSTLIRCINRLEEHDDGRIVVDGIELSRDIRNIQEIRRETGMVFQSFNLFPHLSVLDNVMLAPRNVRKIPKGEAEEQALAMLDHVQILDQASKYPGQLSGGQQQRVAIARGISLEPRLLVLDEPTSALDVSVQAQIINLLEDLQREFGMAYLFVAHDLGVVRHVS
ncbi:MAG: amino acid ABC transporter ATP-binding protein, partial [Acidimicrobiales bacterium]